ncbi:SDR family oxidoreductase [Paenibacillus sediminis]|uniref:Short-subunit dehydrogenase n=1 Tax=Paenibacillus sediminis TaxID=664909 RepID=A0ABS4H5S6_9BACL|nr:SDR family oxidoreductase [Paenibacillus sediminis]MBP1937894.1 short-subunit dehydrogenase [Paenibacillus sediminis]
MLNNKVVVITGASSGIGAITAQMLSERGAIPVLAARSMDKLQKVGERLTNPHLLIQMDVTDQQQVDSGFKRIYDTYGRVDILLNNAGYGVFEYADRMDTREFAAMMDVNYMGIVRCTKAVLPKMLEARSGHIVNVASAAGKIATSKSSAYSATKHAVLGFSNALRQELRGTGVKVSTINPGPIDTPFFEVADPSGQYVSNVKWFMMKPEKVAKTIVSVMEKQKEEVDLPRLAGIGLKLYQLFPRLADRLTYNMLNKK